MVMMSSVVLGAGVMARNALQLLESNIRVSLSHSLTHSHTHTHTLSLSQCPAPPGSEHWSKSLRCPPAPATARQTVERSESEVRAQLHATSLTPSSAGLAQQDSRLIRRHVSTLLSALQRCITAQPHVPPPFDHGCKIHLGQLHPRSLQQALMQRSNCAQDACSNSL